MHVEENEEIDQPPISPPWARSRSAIYSEFDQRRATLAGLRGACAQWLFRNQIEKAGTGWLARQRRPRLGTSCSTVRPQANNQV